MGKQGRAGVLIIAAATIISIFGLGAAGRDAVSFDFSEFENPGVQYRPFVRWWWPGNDVEDAELRREVDLLSDNFFGGAEIQAFEAGLGSGSGPEELSRRHSFDTESFYGHVAAVMEEARSKGLTIDLTLGSGWPSGGSHIRPEQSMKTLFWGEAIVRGPGKKKVAIPKPQKPALYKLSSVLQLVVSEAEIRWMPDQARLVTVVAARELGGRRSKNPLNLTSSVRLDSGSVQVLGKPDADGKIEWQVPEGKWRVIAVYVCPDGQYVSLSAEDPAKSFVADYFDAETFRSNLEHLAGERTGLQKYYGRPLRAIFNDSFELKTERFFTPDFLAEFQKRRGYDLAPLLAATLIPGADNYLFIDGGLKAKSAFNFSAEDHRLQYDYQLTVSDLFIERFIENAAGWAEGRGLQSRVQAYGVNVDVIKAMGLSSIPATEQLYAGGYEAFLKMAAAGAHLYNKNIVDSESMVWMGKGYMTTPLKLKASADKMFSSGVNEVNYHGFSYKKDSGYGEAGWFPFAGGFSDQFAEGNPIWKYMPQINRYLARCQYALRQGQPEADVLIYYPWFGFPTSFDQMGNNDELLFNGEFMGEPEGPLNSLIAIGSKLFPMGPDDRAQWRTAIRPLIKDLEDNGYTWDWVNADSLNAAKVEAGKIFIRGNSWKGLLIFNVKSMPPETAEKIIALAQDRAPVLVVGATPSEQPGYKDFEQGDLRVKAAMANLLKSGAKSSDARGAVEALKALEVEPGISFAAASKVRLIRRRLGPEQQLVFFRNPEPGSLGFSFSVEAGCDHPQWLNPWSGQRAIAKNNPEGQIMAEFPAFGSMALVCGREIAAGIPVWPQDRVSSGEILLKPWSLTVTGEDVKGKTFSQNLDELVDWRQIPALKYCSTPGTYRTEFQLEQMPPGQKAILELNWVYGAAEVKVNGKFAGVMLVPRFELDVTSLLQPGKNQIEIVSVPALRNRFAGKANAGDKGYAQFKGRDDALPSGILGPVIIRRLGIRASEFRKLRVGDDLQK